MNKHPADIFLFKINSKKNKTMFKILTEKAPEQVLFWCILEVTLAVLDKTFNTSF